jgi:nitronate monooxygenase
MNWTKTAITSRLEIRYPLIVAPMAYITTPELVAAVCEAGALGSLPGGALSPPQLSEQIGEVKELTDAPFAVNLFAPYEVADPGESIERMQEALAPWRARLGLEPDPSPTEVKVPDFEGQLEVVLEERPAAFSFTFGVPPADAMAALRDAGIVTMGTATTVPEARRLEQAGCDVVVAQGSEAGGHRGTFDGPFEAGLIGTMALVPQIADAVGCPVVAAGGIMDGRGIAATLTLGAAAAQLGTAFMASAESGAPDAYKRSLSEASGSATTVTTAYTGRPLRVLRTRFVEEIEQSGVQIPPYPIQQQLMAELRQAGVDQGELDVVGRLAGQGVPQIRTGPAAELVTHLIEETDSAIRRLQY